jgi:hypothetical protein
MNDNQRQIILGSLLGNGYICKGRKSDYFCMRHSVNHLPWLQSKAAELTEFNAGKPWYQHETTCTWRSRCDPVFNDLRKLCYPGGKKQITMDWLNPLRDIGIAVWYGDSGCLTGRNNKNACLRTQSFDLEGNQIIEKYFNEVGLECSMNKSRKSYIVVFSVKATTRLIEMIGNCLPTNRYFKMLLGDQI